MYVHIHYMYTVVDCKHSYVVRMFWRIGNQLGGAEHDRRGLLSGEHVPGRIYWCRKSWESVWGKMLLNPEIENSNTFVAKKLQTTFHSLTHSRKLYFYTTHVTSATRDTTGCVYEYHHYTVV